MVPPNGLPLHDLPKPQIRSRRDNAPRQVHPPQTLPDRHEAASWEATAFSRVTAHPVLVMQPRTPEVPRPALRHCTQPRTPQRSGLRATEPSWAGQRPGGRIGQLPGREAGVSSRDRAVARSRELGLLAELPEPLRRGGWPSHRRSSARAAPPRTRRSSKWPPAKPNASSRLMADYTLAVSALTSLNGFAVPGGSAGRYASFEATSLVGDSTEAAGHAAQAWLVRKRAA